MGVVRRRWRKPQWRERPVDEQTCLARCSASTRRARSRPTTRSTARRPATTAIWAPGLRNPFTFAFNPGRIEMHINDVGQNTWEEINEGIAGANYGWPTTEGSTTDPSFVSPRYAYSHSGGTCAITGGAFYAPQIQQFPAEYLNDYFFADYCAGWIRKLDASPGTGMVTFATGISFPLTSKSPTTAVCTTSRAAPADRPASSIASGMERLRQASRRTPRARRCSRARR